MPLVQGVSPGIQSDRGQFRVGWLDPRHVSGQLVLDVGQCQTDARRAETGDLVIESDLGKRPWVIRPITHAYERAPIRAARRGTGSSGEGEMEIDWLSALELLGVVVTDGPQRGIRQRCTGGGLQVDLRPEERSHDQIRIVGPGLDPACDLRSGMALPTGRQGVRPPRGEPLQMELPLSPATQEKSLPDLGSVARIERADGSPTVDHAKTLIPAAGADPSGRRTRPRMMPAGESWISISVGGCRGTGKHSWPNPDLRATSARPKRLAWRSSSRRTRPSASVVRCSKSTSSAVSDTSASERRVEPLTTVTRRPSGSLRSLPADDCRLVSSS
jgi:hypothetical protein